MKQNTAVVMTTAMQCEAEDQCLHGIQIQLLLPLQYKRVMSQHWQLYAGFLPQKQPTLLTGKQSLTELSVTSATLWILGESTCQPCVSITYFRTYHGSKQWHYNG